MSHKKYRAETNCLNCGVNVMGKFCQNCGQENLETRENFLHLAFHTVADFFHFDSKFFRSFRPLFLKPGFLTVQYWEGKRTHYIHPLRLFFFITIVMVITANAYYKKYEKQIKEEKIIRTDSTEPKSEAEIEEDKKSEKKIIAVVNDTFDVLAVYLKYISFLLLPVYAFGFKLLYLRAKRYYVDHLVFTLHLQSFIYIVICVILLVPLFFLPSSRDWITRVVVITTILYLILSLRYVYRQSWFKTILKSILATVYMVFVTILFVALLMITFLLAN